MRCLPLQSDWKFLLWTDPASVKWVALAHHALVQHLFGNNWGDSQCDAPPPVRLKHAGNHGKKLTMDLHTLGEIHKHYILKKLLNEGFRVLNRIWYNCKLLFIIMCIRVTPLIYIEKLNKHWHLFPCNIRITRALDVDFFPWFAACSSLTAGGAPYCEFPELLSGLFVLHCVWLTPASRQMRPACVCCL